MPYQLVISANRIRGQWFSFSKACVCYLCCCMCTAVSSVGLAVYVYMGGRWMICVPRLGLSHIFPNLEKTAQVSMLYSRTGIGLFFPAYTIQYKGISTVHTVLQDLEYYKVCYQWVPCLLTSHIAPSHNQYQQACNWNTTLISNWRNSGHKYLLVKLYYVLWNQDTPASELQIM